MWVKMNQAQINEMLDGLISKRTKSRRDAVIGGSIIMLGVAVVLNMTLFVPLTPFLSNSVPPEIEVLARIIAVFFILEFVVFIVWVVDSCQFKKMDLRKKREYYYENIKNKNTKICPKCGLVFNNGEVRCTSCAGPLEMAYDYMWVEDEIPSS